MPPISVLLKPASSLCNMRCDYCFYCDEAARRERKSYGMMTPETLRNILRRTLPRAQGAASVAFQGGEPTLRGLDFFREAVALERRYLPTGVRISNALQTNGLLLDEDWCRFLAQERFLVGLSVDGLPETHDRYRHRRDSGASSFAGALRAAEMMDRFGVEYNILTVVHAQTAERIDEIYAFYKEKGWLYQQYIACMDPLEAKPCSQPFSLTPEAYGDSLIRLFDLWYEDALLGRQPYIRQFENWAGLLLGVLPEACEQRGECAVQYACEADGSVYPCDFAMLDETRLGNFNTDRLDAVDEARRRIGFVEASRKLDPDCQSCNYRLLCRGGCARQRVTSPDGYGKSRFCAAYQRFFDACLPRLREILQNNRRP